MIKQNYVKLNNSSNYLSLGNFFRIIKEESNCKNTFLQSDFFCILFDIDSIADSTVNNYITGFREINSIYKEKIISKKNNFLKDPMSFLATAQNIISILENKVLNSANISEINSNLKLFNACSQLFNIAKNDNDVPKYLIELLRNLLKNNNLYEFTANVLFYIVLEKKQPISIESKLIKSINSEIKHTNISPNEITEFINTQLEESMWSSLRKINELAKKDNAFACLQMAFYEFYGLIAGYPRYIKAYNYYKAAANKNHASANWAIGFMYYKGYIGNQAQKDFETSIKYFEKAKELGSAAAINSLGLIYLEGKVAAFPKSKEKAIELFELAISKGSVFALNNLGLIYEKEGKYLEAFRLFERSASTGESWASNKVGEYYRTGKYVIKDMKKAFEYYNKSDENSVYFMCPWSKYNLARYFYEPGNEELGIEPNVTKAIELLEIASKDILEASEELIFIYYKIYLKSQKKDLYSLEKVNCYIKKIEASPKYNDEVKIRIENIMKDIYENRNHINFNY